MPAEARETLRRWLTTGQAPPVATVEAAGELIEAARVQGVAGLLHSAVESQGPAWPEAARGRLREMHRSLLARAVAQLDLARRAQEILGRAEVRSLPLKGAATAEWLYDSPGDRPMSDVDLLALGAWNNAVGALQREGFRVLEAADHAWGLFDPVSGGVLELHHSVCSCPGFYATDTAGLWERSRAGAGQVERLPSVEDLLVHLSLHAAFQHGLLLTLVQWLDFRRLLERGRPDAGRVAAQAARSGAEAAVAAALSAAQAVVGAPVEPSLRDLSRAWHARGLRKWVVALQASPLAMVVPAPSRLLRVRWELAQGRRTEWVRRTLAPTTPGGGKERPWPLRAALRGFGLALRWGPEAWAGWKRPAP